MELSESAFWVVNRNDLTISEIRWCNLCYLIAGYDKDNRLDEFFASCAVYTSEDEAREELEKYTIINDVVQTMKSAQTLDNLKAIVSDMAKGVMT